MNQKTYATHAGLSRARVCQLARQGMPLTSPEAADQWRRLNTWSRRPPAAGPPKPPEPSERPPEAAQADADTGANEITAAWGRAVKAERVAWALLSAALKAASPDAARMLSLHAQSCRHLADNRGRFLDLAEREKRLVSGDWVRRVMQEHDGVLAQLIKNMPRQMAGRIAPQDPEHCEKELNRWVEEVLLKTIHDTDPWR